MVYRAPISKSLKKYEQGTLLRIQEMEWPGGNGMAPDISNRVQTNRIQRSIRTIRLFSTGISRP